MGPWLAAEDAAGWPRVDHGHSIFVLGANGEGAAILLIPGVIAL